MVRALALFLIPAMALGAPLKLVTSTTDLAWAARRVGGAHVEVRPFLKGTENPHYVDAVPEFIRLAAEAKVACLIGLDLEIGWMPKVLARSMNAQVQSGGKGYCEVGKAIEVLEKPTGPIDRSMGDVHPAGNPHFWLSPPHLAQASKVIYDTLVTVDPAHLADYKANVDALKADLDAIAKRNQAKLKPLVAGHSGPILLEYHKEFSYFLQTYGLTSLGSLEEKPGITPSAGRIAEMAMAAKGAGVKFILAGDTAPRKTLEKFAELSKLPVVIVPLSLVPSKKPTEYGEHQDLIIDAIVTALKTPRT